MSAWTIVLAVAIGLMATGGGLVYWAMHGFHGADNYNAITPFIVGLMLVAFGLVGCLIAALVWHFYR